MYASKCNFVILAAVLALSGSCYAQTASTTPQQCVDAPSLNWNDTALLVPWYEVARNPGNSSLGCVEVTATLNNMTLSIKSTYSVQPNAWYMNITEMASVTLIQDSQTGYNLTFVNPLNNASQTTTYKLLDYNPTWGFVAGCGYTDASNNATSFGFIMSQLRFANSTWLNMYNNELAANYTNFMNGTIDMVAQSEQCYTSGALTARSLPLYSMLAALAYLVLKLSN